MISGIRPAPSRLPRPLLIAAFAGLLVGVIIVAVLAIFLRRPSTKGCDSPPCPGPPVRKAPLARGTVWRSSLGFQVEYDSETWAVAPGTDPEHLELRWLNGDMTLWVGGGAGSQAAPLDLMNTRVAELRHAIPSLAADCVKVQGALGGGGCPHPEQQLLGPNVGYVHGIGGMWAGATSSDTQLKVVVMAAGDGRFGAVVSAVTSIPFGGWGSKWMGALVEADSVVNSFIWPGQNG